MTGLSFIFWILLKLFLLFLLLNVAICYSNFCRQSAFIFFVSVTSLFLRVYCGTIDNYVEVIADLSVVGLQYTTKRRKFSHKNNWKRVPNYSDIHVHLIFFPTLLSYTQDVAYRSAIKAGSSTPKNICSRWPLTSCMYDESYIKLFTWTLANYIL